MRCSLQCIAGHWSGKEGDEMLASQWQNFKVMLSVGTPLVGQTELAIPEKRASVV